ncbi:MAG: MFS transporter [Chromatiales bacterium]|nr:MFS transporter [Chromatiales bacterium]
MARLPFYYGWVVIAVAFFTLAISVNTRSVFSLLFPPVLAEMNWDRSTTAAAFSVGFMTSALYTPLIGMFLDSFGPRYVIPTSALLVSLGLLMTTQITSPWELYFAYGMLVVGASIPMSYMGHGTFLPNWFVHRRGLALGIAFSGVGFGAIVLFPWLQSLIDGPGWRHACIALAALLLFLVIPLNLIAQRNRPEEIGLLADGVDADGSDGGVPDNVIDREWAAVDWTVGRAIRTARFWWVFLAMASSLFTWYAIQIHQTRYLLDVGFSTDTAALALGAVPFAGLVGQLAIGHFSDQVGREWAWTLCSGGFIVCYVALLLISDASDVGLLWLMILSQGCFGYGLPIVLSAVPNEIFAGRHYGAIFGMLSVSAAIGPSAGPWLTGWLFDQYGNYDLAFMMGIGVCCISIVSIWCASPGKVRAVSGRIPK